MDLIRPSRPCVLRSRRATRRSGRRAEATRLYEEAATSARAADRGDLLAAAARCRANVELPADEKASLAARLGKLEVIGDLEGAQDLAHQLWRLDPGHAAVAHARELAPALRRPAGDDQADPLRWRGQLQAERAAA